MTDHARYPNREYTHKVVTDVAALTLIREIEHDFYMARMRERREILEREMHTFTPVGPILCRWGEEPRATHIPSFPPVQAAAGPATPPAPRQRSHGPTIVVFWLTVAACSSLWLGAMGWVVRRFFLRS